MKDATISQERNTFNSNLQKRLTLPIAFQES